MTIAALSTAGFSQYIAASSSVSASQQAFQALQQSLASGNMGQAQAAFTAYQLLNQSPTPAATSTSTGTSSSSTTGSSSTAAPSQFSKDLAALGTAIGSGNLGTAQAAFTTLQGDLKSAPPQAVTNAESAVAQTVSWVDDLLSLSGNSNAYTTPVDPMTDMLDSAYGLTAPSTTDPTQSILENAYGTSGTASSSSSSTPVSASSGNLGSGSSVNAYA
jgi:hypothetical protein